MRNGLQYRFENEHVTWIKDRNGNKTTIEALSGGGPFDFRITDALGRTVDVTKDNTWTGPPAGGVYDQITFKDADGVDQSIKVYRHGHWVNNDRICPPPHLPAGAPPEQTCRTQGDLFSEAHAPLRSYSCSTSAGRPGAGGSEGWGRWRAWMLVFSSAEMRKVPRTLAPRAVCVPSEPAPDGGSADIGDPSLRQHFLPDVLHGKPGQRQSAAARQLTGEGLDLDDETRWESWPYARLGADPGGRADGRERIVHAACSRSDAACRGARR
jgi:hypothetical protein